MGGDGGLQFLHRPHRRKLVDRCIGVLATERHKVPVVATDAQTVAKDLFSFFVLGQARPSILARPGCDDHPVLADGKFLHGVTKDLPKLADKIAKEIHIPGPVEIGHGRDREVSVVPVMPRVHGGEESKNRDLVRLRVSKSQSQPGEGTFAVGDWMDWYIGVDRLVRCGCGRDFEGHLSLVRKFRMLCCGPLEVRLKRLFAGDELEANPGSHGCGHSKGRGCHGGIRTFQRET